jgi:hypothetical protein
METTPKSDNTAGHRREQQPCYDSLRGRLIRKWDWWIYRRAFHSLRRMTLDNPGMAYLMELQIREWNEKLNISPELRRATEYFHESLRNHSQHNSQLTQPPRV